MSAVKPLPERHAELMKALGKRLEEFLDDPFEEGLHDLRTAIRRAEASTRALPKSFRKRGKTRRLRKKLEKFMKKSAKVRDLDTVKTRLSDHPRDRALEKLKQQAEDMRKKPLKSTIAVAESIRGLSVLSPDEDELDEGATRKRLERIVKKLGLEMNRTLPTVTAHPEDKAALHGLRKDCKRLRYTLELSLARPSESKVVKTLVSWQDLLGAVRDADVTIEFLQRIERSAEVEEILTWERSKRREAYEKFVRSSKETFDVKIPA